MNLRRGMSAAHVEGRWRDRRKVVHTVRPVQVRVMNGAALFWRPRCRVMDASLAWMHLKQSPLQVTCLECLGMDGS